MSAEARVVRARSHTRLVAETAELVPVNAQLAIWLRGSTNRETDGWVANRARGTLDDLEAVDVDCVGC